MSPKTSLILLPALAAALAGCSTSKQMMNNQGYIADEELVASVQPGVDNKESVQKALGRPTMAAQWSDDTWYYVSRNTKQLAFARPKPETQRVLIIRFDKAGNVAGVERRGLEQVANISPNSDRTPTLGREASLLEDLFGNLGTVGSMPGAGGGGPQ
ncbi:outer membrane protein assembly factor BamE [Sandaracinobacter sp. RS1-74]|uniref:outer membrane protein assembly factor BamE n=1 Tax=Sandaracinobacteroides sayramensis TaxID=2913411 RepID=UPI001EDB4C82|nr:outer membrane protein assembly factor BamE [Sandaracinobacteroides sayramensis]MCG2842561.1 outer membrane protein assembly factor BamE [Sandaracinobacteroides sayramensis]